MREHPIPQDITGYRFHIIGSMTLKQFAEIFLGVIVALVFYKTNLFAPIKWFFVIASVGIGVAAAFVPIEERPLDHWITTFFSILYKPTKFFWKKTPKIPEAFTYTATVRETNPAEQVDLTPIRRDRIKEYLRSIHAPKVENPIDAADQERIQQILQTFSSQPAVSTSPQKHIAQKPDLSVRVRKMRTDVVLLPKKEVQVFPDQPIASTTLTNDRDFAQKKKAVLATDQVAQQISVPETKLISTDTQTTTQEELELTPLVDMQERAYVTPQQNVIQDADVATSSTTFNASLPFPSVPDIPNKIVGMILSASGDLITDAIVEIHDETGNIVRAVKTNALGQFFISTPLNNGIFTLITEKDGLTFTPQQLTLTGEVVPPIEVRSV